MTLGERIRALREDRGWSQFDLAVKSGTSIANVWKIESGKTASPSIATLQKLATALEVRVADLTGELAPEQWYSSDATKRRIQARLETISSDKAEELEQLFEAFLGMGPDVQDAYLRLITAYHAQRQSGVNGTKVLGKAGENGGIVGATDSGSEPAYMDAEAHLPKSKQG